MSDQSSQCHEGKCLTFLQMIEHYGGIEIPLIQRDYAQGRESAEGVRRRFLNSLFTAIQEGKPKPLNLDFIYGNVANDVQSLSGRKFFEPIDGQQRLTTLFLLHWYLALKGGQLEDFCERLCHNGESRFRYSVRQSSNRFFTQLLNSDFWKDWQGEWDAIPDQPWFRWGWRHDATITGSLRMIEALDERFEQCSPSKAGEFYNDLTQEDEDSRLITMDVLDIQSMGLTDAIYVKMNATGIELTGFEKFKAWLVGKYEENQNLTDRHKDWHKKLDCEWLELFWHYHSNKAHPAAAVSKVYFQTILALAINYHASCGTFEKDWLGLDANNQEDSWNDLWTEECLQLVFQHLERLSKVQEDGPSIKALRIRLGKASIPFPGEPEDKGLVTAFLEGTAKATLEDRLWLYAICISLQRELSGDNELSWFRVVRNLLENSNLSSENFSNAAQALSQLDAATAEHGSVLAALVNIDEMKGLSGEQWKEEAVKAERLRSEQRDDWEKSIQEAECHPVLKGQIGFLLDGADLNLFEKRWDMFNRRLLDKDGSRLGKDEYLLIRSVLACSDPIDLGWQEKIVLQDTASNWSNLLKRGRFRENFGKGLRSLIDKLIIDKLNENPDLEKGMLKILEEAESSKESRTPWMNTIIRYGGDLLSKSETKKVQNYYNHGFFLFFKSNRNPSDILIGKYATLRNQTIHGMVEDRGWRFKDREPDDVRIKVSESEPPFFYKNHWPRLLRSEDDGVYCRFDYNHVKIGKVGDDDAEQTVGYAGKDATSLLEKIEEFLTQGCEA